MSDDENYKIAIKRGERISELIEENQALKERIKKLEGFIINGVENGYILMPDNPDPARKTIDNLLNRGK